MLTSNLSLITGQTVDQEGYDALPKTSKSQKVPSIVEHAQLHMEGFFLEYSGVSIPLPLALSSTMILGDWNAAEGGQWLTYGMELS